MISQMDKPFAKSLVASLVIIVGFAVLLDRFGASTPVSTIGLIGSYIAACLITFHIYDASATPEERSR